MGPITQELTRVLSQHVAKEGIVVWFDPHQAFRDAAAQIQIPGTSCLAFDGSFYQLQHAAEEHLLREERPRLLVYIPGIDSVMGTPLLELSAIGGTYKEGLKSIAHRALAALHVRKARIDELLATPNLTVSMVETTAALEIGVPEPLRSIFGGASSEEILVRTLSDAGVLASVRAAGVEDVLSRYLGELLGFAIPSGADLEAAIWERVLVTEFVSDLQPGATIPPRALERASLDRVTQALCSKVAERQRQVVDERARKRYADRSEAVARALDLEAAPLDAFALGHIDTFAFEERRVLRAAVERALAGDPGAARATIEERRGTFWLRHDPKREAAWSAAALAMELIEKVEGARKTLPAAAATPDRWVHRYMTSIQGSDALFEIDRLARRAERQIARAESDDVRDLVGRARDAYAGLVHLAAEQFANAIDQHGFETIHALPPQSRVFHECVEPLLATGPVAYILADALRYDMAEDVRRLVEGEGGVTCELAPRVATLPTVTSVGMTALLPGAERGLELVVSGKRLGLRIATVPVFDRDGREGVFKHFLGSKVQVGKLDELVERFRRLPKTKRKGSTPPTTALPSLLVAWWGDIDTMGEHGSTEPLRAYFSQMVEHLARSIRELGDAGFRHVVVVSDHGHVFTESRGKEMEIDPPSGNALDVQRRHWVGRGVTANRDIIRIAASNAGLGGDLELAFPRGLSVMRWPSKTFFHGGISLQELLVPALTVTFPARVARDERKFTVHPIIPRVSAEGGIMAEVLYEKTLLDDASANVQLVGVIGDRIVTRLKMAPGSVPGTETIVLKHGERAICYLELHAPGSRSGLVRLEVRSRDGGRVLNRPQPPPELAFDLPETGTAATPARTEAASPLGPTEVELLLAGTTSPRRIDLGFAIADEERRVLEALARDDNITERAVGRLIGRKGASFFMATLIDRLIQHGHHFVEQDEDGDEGATYRFRRARVRGAS